MLHRTLPLLLLLCGSFWAATPAAAQLYWNQFSVEVFGGPNLGVYHTQERFSPERRLGRPAPRLSIGGRVMCQIAPAVSVGVTGKFLWDRGVIENYRDDDLYWTNSRFLRLSEDVGSLSYDGLAHQWTLTVALFPARTFSFQLRAGLEYDIRHAVRFDFVRTEWYDRPLGNADYRELPTPRISSGTWVEDQRRDSFSPCLGLGLQYRLTDRWSLLCEADLAAAGNPSYPVSRSRMALSMVRKL